MEMLKLTGLCAVCLVPILLLRKSAPEQAFLLTAAVLAAAFFRCAQALSPVLVRIQALLKEAGLSAESCGILLRVMVLTVISRLCADLCRDGGSHALGAVVELAGTVGALAVSMPLLEKAVTLLMRYFT